MMEYVLILTMTMFGGQYNALSSSQAVDHIPGFVSEVECKAAGDAWIRQQQAIRTSIQRKQTTALCVRRTRHD